MTFLSSCLRTSTFQNVATVSRGRRPICVRLTNQNSSRHQNTTTARRHNTTTTNSTTTNTGNHTGSGPATPKNNATPVHHTDTGGNGYGSGGGGKRIGPLSLAIGTIAGTCGSLAGMGGGFIMIPLMTSARFGLGLTQHQAHGTSLCAVATTGIAGALSYSGYVDVEAAVCIAATGMLTARAGAQATTKLSAVTLKKALGLFMLLIAPTIPLKEYYFVPQTTKNTTHTKNEDVDNKKKPDEKSPSPSLDLQRYAIPMLIGSCSGFLAGVFGVGGGAIVVPALTCCTELNHYEALGTSLCAMVPTAIVGTLTHAKHGAVAFRVAPWLSGGAFLGAYCGGQLGQTLPEHHLKLGFSATLAVLGLRTLL